MLRSIGLCLTVDRVPGRREVLIGLFESESMDWDKFVYLSGKHYVQQVIFLKLRDAGLLSYLPEGLDEYLQMVFEMNEKRNRQILEQMDRITKLLNSIGVEPVYLKGNAGLADGLYSEIGERIVRDIDFLVSPTQINTVVDAIYGQGYVMRAGNCWLPGQMKHYPRMHSPNELADVEVHQAPIELEIRGVLSFSDIDRAKKRVANSDLNFAVPDDLHKIIHNFAHAHLNDRGHIYRRTSLRNLYDILLLSDRVNLNSAIARMPRKKEAKAYFLLAKTFFDLDDSFFTCRSWSANFYLKQFIYFQSHPKLSSLNRRLFDLFQKIRYSYFKVILMAFTDKPLRDKLKERLTSVEWWREHIDSYLKIFRSK